MRVIFVASGNKTVGKCSSFVQSQYDSLVAEGLDVQLYPVVGHGVKGFLRNLCSLRRLIRKWKPDIIHAHYSTFGILSWLASLGLCHRPKILVSILGSFPSRNFKWRYVRFFIKHIWAGTLTKSKRTANQLGFDLPIVSNGVNTSIFYPVSESEREELRLRLFSESQQSVISTQYSVLSNHKSQITNKKYIIWCSNPEREEKNWPLAEEAIRLLQLEVSAQKSAISSQQSQIELIAVYNKTPQEVAQYMNAADCLLLTSMSEGSPNVIKEAMACNCPIVTTDVGDVQERLDGLSGCFVIPTDDTPTYGLQGVGEWFNKDAQYLSGALRNALDFGQRTQGYDRIIQDGLTIELTAKKIVRLYTLILNK
ncbi:MAG: glycosyltransferase [Bacteroidales bacterium]|nr:glycosyltransferase [Candidatus Colicola equi]